MIYEDDVRYGIAFKLWTEMTIKYVTKYLWPFHHNLCEAKIIDKMKKWDCCNKMNAMWILH